MSDALPRSFKLGLFEGAVLLYNTASFPEKDLDPERSPVELATAMSNSAFGWIKRIYLETGLYYCNLLDEDGKFWHPQNKSFDRFLEDILPDDLAFDKTYNFIYIKD